MHLLVELQLECDKLKSVYFPLGHEQNESRLHMFHSTVKNWIVKQVSDTNLLQKALGGQGSFTRNSCINYKTCYNPASVEDLAQCVACWSTN